MELQFTEADIMLIEKEIRCKSYADIAFLLDKTLEELEAFLSTWLPGKEIIPFQQLLQEKKKRAPKVPVATKPRQKQEKAPRKKEQKQPDPKKHQVEISWQRQSQENKRRVKVFQVVQKDFSGLVPVRIDHKTTVYAKPGQDPEEVRRKYLKNRPDQKVA